MWWLGYISAHMHVDTHTYTHTETFANAHTKLLALITYIQDHLLWFAVFDYGF